MAKFWMLICMFLCVSVSSAFAQPAENAESEAPAAEAAATPESEEAAPTEVETAATTNTDDLSDTVSSSASGEDSSDEGRTNPVTGKWGVGYFTTSAPFGVRRWFSDRLGFDAGFGVNVNTQGPTTTWGLGFEGGILFALAHLENIIVFARGGMGISVDDPGAGANLGVNLNGMLGGEFFLTEFGFPNLSLSGGVGAQINLDAPNGGDFGFEFTTTAAPVNVVTAALLGFHLYF